MKKRKTMESELEAAKQSASELEGRIASAEQARADADAALAAEKQRADDAEARATAAAESAGAEASAREQQLQEDLASASEKNASLGIELEASKHQESVISAKLSEAEARLSDMETRARAAAKIEEQYMAADAKLEDLERELNEADGKLVEAEARLTKANGEASSALKDKAKLEAELEALMQQSAALEQRLGDAEAQRDSTQVEELLQSLGSRDATIAELQADLARLQAIEAAATDSAELDGLRKELTAREHDVKALQQAAEDAKSRANAHAAREAELSESLRTVKAELEASQKQGAAPAGASPIPHASPMRTTVTARGVGASDAIAVSVGDVESGETVLDLRNADGFRPISATPLLERMPASLHPAAAIVDRVSLSTCALVKHQPLFRIAVFLYVVALHLYFVLMFALMSRSPGGAPGSLGQMDSVDEIGASDG